MLEEKNSNFKVDLTPAPPAKHEMQNGKIIVAGQDLTRMDAHHNTGFFVRANQVLKNTLNHRSM